MILYYSIFVILLACTLLYINLHRGVPILMYHRIANIPGDRNALPLTKFRQQMDYLTQNGFTTVTMQMVYEFYQLGKALPPKPVLLSFDDGYKDNLTAALPILKERKLTAVIFPITNWIGKENHWENFNKAVTQTMDWDELYCWKDAGMEIAAHTVNHPFLTQCTEEQLQYELRSSKATLEEKLAMKIDFICYPYGNFNQVTMDAVKLSGYKAAFAIFDNVPLWHINPFCLPRIPIPARQSLWEFKLKVSRIYIMFIALRKWERNIKCVFRKKK